MLWDNKLSDLVSIDAHKNVVKDIDFSPSWCKFVSCSDDREVKIYDFSNQKEIFTFLTSVFNTEDLELKSHYLI